MNFAAPTVHIVKIKESEKKREGRHVLRPYSRTEKAVEREGNGNSNQNWRTWSSPKKIEKRSEDESRLFKLKLET